MLLLVFSGTCISRGSVVMQLKCGGMFNIIFIASCTENVPVKKF